MPRKMKAKAFAHEVRVWLDARTRFGSNVAWDVEKALPGSRKDFVDVACTIGARKLPSVLVEIELHREDPVSNVVKIFKWAEDNKIGKTLFIQAFSHLYERGKAERKERAIFLGRVLEKETSIRYVPMNLKYSPRPGGRFGAGRRTHAAKLLARRIMEHLLRSKFIPHK